MSLVTEIELLSLSLEQIGHLVRADENGFQIVPEKDWRGKLTGRCFVTITDFHAHDFLTDAADWSQQFWAFISDFPPRLVQLLDRVFKISPNGFTFSAMWIGHKPEEELLLAWPDFKRAILRNEIGTRTKYVIKH